MQTYMLNMRIYANYALCSNSAIMPKSNAGIIGPPQWRADGLIPGQCLAFAMCDPIHIVLRTLRTKPIMF